VKPSQPKTKGHFWLDLGKITIKGDRLRAPNEAKIKEIAASIQQNGLLQQPSVREVGDNEYELVYGANRFAALRSLGVEKALFDVYPSDTPDDIIRLAEIAENLHRAELTADEKAVLTVRYAELLKRTDAVQSRRARQAETRLNVKSVDDKPTVTEKLAEDLGVSRQTVHERFKKVAELAGSEGVETAAGSFEEASPEQLAEMSEAAGKAAQKFVSVEYIRSKPKKPKKISVVTYVSSEPERTVVRPKYISSKSPLEEFTDALDAVLNFPLDDLPDSLPDGRALEKKVVKASDRLAAVRERLTAARTPR
jgi:ParB/RepB/Spo0J family partition protein